jgi:hypothetical protein
VTPQEIQKIDAAAAAHGQWLTRLRTAIETGTSEFKPQVVATDNACDFGKWLYGEFPAALRGTPAYEAIRTAHAKFHASAAKILQLAIDGRKGEALKLMDPQGEFMTLSGSLLLKLRALKS